MASIASTIKTVFSTGLKVEAILPFTAGSKGVFGVTPTDVRISRFELIKELLSKKEYGYHGTSEAAMGKQQLAQRQFEDQGKKVFVDNDISIAVKYAARSAELHKSKPIVLLVTADHAAEMNSISKDGWGFGLGAYDYVQPSKGKVEIVARLDVTSIQS